MSRPYELTASEALRAIRRRELGVGELVQSLLDRIRDVEPSVGAWELVDEDGALTSARERDATVDRAAFLPLFGIPLGLKDIYSTRGLTTSAGFPPWASKVPDHGAATVERARQA